MNEINDNTEKLQISLEENKKLLRQLVAIHLYTNGANQDEISKNLRIAKVTINQMLKGIKKAKK